MKEPDFKYNNSVDSEIYVYFDEMFVYNTRLRQFFKIRYLFGTFVIEHNGDYTRIDEKFEHLYHKNYKKWLNKQILE